MRLYLFTAILLFSTPTLAETIGGKVVNVIDGDTIVVRQTGVDYRIRMLGIDAPEYHQPYGKDSRRALDRQIGGKWVKVRYKTQDRYGRYLGTVYYHNNNINLDMLRDGQAWVYPRYRNDREFMSREEQARRQKLGLWRNPDPQSPWAYRLAQ